MNIRLVSSIKDISVDAWRKLESADFPFSDYEFLRALEDTASIGAESGWDPLYIIAEDASGPVGALCSYIKSHSYGEYIFDWEWARFYRQQGQPYYPKLLTAVPFTPATGPRILLRIDADATSIGSQLIKTACDLARQARMSSYHALFIPKRECPIFAEQLCMIRHSFQYHWRHAGYRDFQDFLDGLVGKRRRDIQRERLRAQSHGLELACLTASELTDELAMAMEGFYLATAEKKDAIPYLRTGFFKELFRSMADRILLTVARRGDELIAAALNFYKGRTLFGRYWGSLEPFPDLHFELCYYMTMEFAIKNGFTLFEAGAQGEHKVQRGFMPSLTFSAHAIFDARFRTPTDHYIARERDAVDQICIEIAAKGPFKNIEQPS